MISEESTQDGEISQRRRENFYTTLQYKIGQMIAQSQIYLNHAPNHEKHALCQEIRVAQIELANLVTACRKYPRLDVVRELDVKHEQLHELPVEDIRSLPESIRAELSKLTLTSSPS